MLQRCYGFAQVVGKSTKNIERAAGISGAVLAAPWVFQGVLRIVDWISRAQTAMAIIPYLGIFASPAAFVIELAGVTCLLFYATRLEHYREAEETPRIIRAWSEPDRPKRHWFWLKGALASGSLSVLAAIFVFVLLHNRIPRAVNPASRMEAVGAVEGMRAAIRGAIQRRETVTFLISWPQDDNTYLVFISSLLSSACRDTPRQCWFTEQGTSPGELDKPPVKGGGKRGITVHGPDANILANALSAWFDTYSTSSVPAEYNGYKERGTRDLIWIDIGPGSPWKQ
jgi:hypothetical protein